MPKTVLAAALLLSLSLFLSVEVRISPAFAQATEASTIGTLKEIIPGHYTYNSNGFVSGIIVTDEGVVVVDALSNEAMARDERQQISSVIRKPVRYLISSSFHDNYTKGNVAYGDAIKIGHENYKADLLELMKEEPAAEQKARLPDLAYRDRMTLSLGGKEIEILHIGRAHTRGDSIVFVLKTASSI